MPRPIFARQKWPAGGGNLGKSAKTQKLIIGGMGGVEWSGIMEWNGLEWNHGVEWSGMDFSGGCILVILNHFDTFGHFGSTFGSF